jgi:hypothetical protein
MSSINKPIRQFIVDVFGVDMDIFVKALKMSPGSQGAIHGAISELLYLAHCKSLGFEVFRIKEKPKGGFDSKSTEAKGDFYIRKNNWNKEMGLVIECKGIKTNAEKHAGYTDKDKLLEFLRKHSFKRKEKITSNYKSGLKAYNKTKGTWESNNSGEFPDFRWDSNNPGPGIPDLTKVWKNEKDLKNWISGFSDSDFTENKYWDLKAPMRLVQTHMPNTRTDTETNIKSTGPLVNEFNILAIDLFLRTGIHEFVFANSLELNHQQNSPNHLQQNYTIDILLECENFAQHSLLSPWYNNLEECIGKTSPELRKIDDTQLDYR